MQEAALSEDAAAFDYDTVYEQVSSSARQKAQQEAERNNPKPKYMEAIMAAAAQRRQEREAHRMRRLRDDEENGPAGDAEGGEEVFVTAAYRKKLEEMRARGIDPDGKVVDDDEDRERRIGEEELARFRRGLVQSASSYRGSARDAPTSRERSPDSRRH